MRQNKTSVEKFEIVAKTFFGLENILADEIKEIGGENIKIGNRSVSYSGNEELLYRSNIYLRTALRILKPILQVNIEDQGAYYVAIRKIRWEEYFNLHNSFSIDSVIYSDLFKNTHFAALRAKDAIVDSFRDKYNERPSVAKEEADIVINIHLNNNTLTVSLDSSGESLHKRGYRVKDHAAPINEVLAAALVKLSGWDQTNVLIDPMCGSGTIGIEAAMLAKKIPPGLIRKQFCFMNWINYDRNLYKQIIDGIELSDKKIQIICNDISSEAVDSARINASKALVGKHIRFLNKSYDEMDYKYETGTLVINPPYNERLETEDVDAFYGSMGSFFKKNLNGYTVSIITSNMAALKCLGLKPVQKHTLYNGALECKFNNYEIFAGEYKDHIMNGLS